MLLHNKNISFETRITSVTRLAADLTKIKFKPDMANLYAMRLEY